MANAALTGRRSGRFYRRRRALPQLRLSASILARAGHDRRHAPRVSVDDDHGIADQHVLVVPISAHCFRDFRRKIVQLRPARHCRADLKLELGAIPTGRAFPCDDTAYFLALHRAPQGRPIASRDPHRNPPPSGWLNPMTRPADIFLAPQCSAGSKSRSAEMLVATFSFPNRTTRGRSRRGEPLRCPPRRMCGGVAMRRQYPQARPREWEQDSVESLSYLGGTRGSTSVA